MANARLPKGTVTVSVHAIPPATDEHPVAVALTLKTKGAIGVASGVLVPLVTLICTDCVVLGNAFARRIPAVNADGTKIFSAAGPLCPDGCPTEGTEPPPPPLHAARKAKAPTTVRERTLVFMRCHLGRTGRHPFFLLTGRMPATYNPSVALGRVILSLSKDWARASWGCSSAGRALASHVRGRGFESPHLHQLRKSPTLSGFFTSYCCRIRTHDGVLPKVA